MKEEKGSRGIETSSPPSIHAYIPPPLELILQSVVLTTTKNRIPSSNKERMASTKGGGRGREGRWKEGFDVIETHKIPFFFSSNLTKS